MSLLSKYINRQLAAYQSELVQTHYQEVENMYRQIRGWRHDYRNHIQVLKSYAKDGDLAQISKYLDELDEVHRGYRDQDRKQNDRCHFKQ